MKRTTLADIAHVAGLSVMSVSKVINDKPGVSEETRARVLKIAKELNYMPNMVAKNLRSSETKSIGVVLSDSSEMVTSKILRAIQDCCYNKGFNTIVSNTDHIPERERNAIKTLISKQIDGLILVAPMLYRKEDILYLQQFKVPFVFLMRKNDQMDIDTVINDNLSGGYQVVEHLLEEGCRRFLFMLIENSQTSMERKTGYLQALGRGKIPPQAYRFIELPPFIDAAEEAIVKELAGEFPYDALVCGCDTQAIGAMNALINAGRRIPEDICLTGYDGIDLAKFLRVGLTTVVQPLYDIGYQGTEILLDRIKYHDIPVRKIVLKSKLVVRESSARRGLCRNDQ